VDRERGGFFEALDLSSRRCTARFRRLRVAARQIIVFSEAHRAGVDGAGDAVRLGVAFLADHAAQADGGYAWRFGLDHAPTDLTRDLYDHAFVLLALSAAATVLGPDALRPQAEALLLWLDSALGHEQGGYAESLPPALPRRQNPHMHLLEALLAAYEVFGLPVFLDRADAVLALFATHLFDAEAGALPEYFDDALRPVRHNATFAVEPGHHCEWVWLLHRARTLGSAQPGLADLSARLMDFVDRYGVDRTRGHLIDLVGNDGVARETSARLWPQTERLKAEFLRPDATIARQLQAIRVLRGYLRPDGLWHERRAADGTLSDEPAPASSLYHLTSAITTVEHLLW